ncbi:Panacea domain-containing protein [Dyadobacter sediminis]|uniref:DUF4065 domain-containing protein n=1 Tax=Dyadobacter sediminis TaxID=1493691 RepID=A0A5R9K665_9BACT|nr:type II toxin-antitoxin system antitoxin SocA domain-containing protein [Dyadobacter sediminis]TLU89134.1 DUF4065 domain-containing protein [Dyadobacter sediminis]GGC02544.1 hypothetical protein GCM10011325_32010 [Dyadobacter sediminis]
MYSSVLIAGQFVNLGIKESNPVTQMKLQKMVFFAHGLHLAINNGNPLIREKFLAWKFGPVVPTIYQLYKQWGNAPIIERTSILVNSKPLEYFSELSESALEAINNTWEITKDVDAITLSNWSHSPDSPWAITYRNIGENGVIDDNLIKNYFEQQIRSTAG